jgi:hypothetical protein
VGDKTWQKNAGSQIFLDSIFAALAGIWISLAMADRIPGTTKLFVVAFSFLSFLMFAMSAEGTTTAYDEKDVLKFVYYLVWYNVGVLSIGVAIAALVIDHFNCKILRHTTAFVCQLSPTVVRFSVYGCYSLVFVIVFWNWIHDGWWLIFGATKSEFADYLKELNDEQDPEPDHGCVMRMVFRKRIIRETTAP